MGTKHRRREKIRTEKKHTQHTPIDPQRPLNRQFVCVRSRPGREIHEKYRSQSQQNQKYLSPNLNNITKTYPINPLTGTVF